MRPLVLVLPPRTKREYRANVKVAPQTTFDDRSSLRAWLYPILINEKARQPFLPTKGGEDIIRRRTAHCFGGKRWSATTRTSRCSRGEALVWRDLHQMESSRHPEWFDPDFDRLLSEIIRSGCGAGSAAIGRAHSSPTRLQMMPANIPLLP